ncbi:sigma-54 dependent transcriptional regulator [Edaphobacter aggregans]|uniref:sigma-54 dependent transcriptional regulator n=1 Tax=Edaphobacter aggregans TaxID=570835 RepID=UPI00068B0701|nr:sigma-54 dependent transcriptional regulator [Edaphobacter aggregans]
MIQIALFSVDRTLQSLLSSALGNEFEVFLAPTEDQIKHMVSIGDCNLVLLDLDSHQESLEQGLQCSLRILTTQVPLIVIASDALRSTAVELVRLGAYGYCRRPPSIRDLKTMLIRAYESSSLKRELQNVQQRLGATNCSHRLIGSSPHMQRVYDLMQRVANINASVLVTGESGTGKELIANGIHNMGIRSPRPFVAVCCGAIPESLIEAELFGHEKGAFTGTVGTRVGYMEQAEDGTLFLDEIGELSLSTQVKLLRVLQQREFSRLGSNRLIPLRARLIFATHQNLDDMVTRSTFRQDLYYRINVMRIDAPALQDHPEDIPQIVAHFLRQYSDMYQKPMVGVEPSAMAALQAYVWPGNVRELENVIQRAIILSRGDHLLLEDLPCSIQEQNVVSIADFQPSNSFERQLRDYKIKLAMTALRECRGNKTLAARSLNISRAYLHRLIRIAEPDMLSEADASIVEAHRSAMETV